MNWLEAVSTSIAFQSSLETVKDPFFDFDFDFDLEMERDLFSCGEFLSISNFDSDLELSISFFMLYSANNFAFLEPSEISYSNAILVCPIVASKWLLSFFI